jgi:endonuclease/exonuclease/phosphatase family metal-dependent hydrolase
MDAIYPLQEDDPDIILAGDFNSSDHHKSLEELSKRSFISLHQKAFRSPDSASISYYSDTSTRKNRGSLIDHIYVSQTHTREWLPHSATIYQPDNPDIFSRTYSDHFPLWIDFLIAKDGD